MPPDQFTTELSNVFAIALTGVFVVLIVADCRHDIRQLVSARNVFLLTLMMWFLLEACLLPKELRLFGFSQTTYNFGLICVISSAIAFLIVYQSASTPLFDPLFRSLIRIDNPTLVWRVFLLGTILGLLPLLVIAKGNIILILEDAFLPHTRWSSPFSRGRYGGLRDAFLELQMFLKAAIPLAAAIVVQPRQKFERKMAAVAFLVYMTARAFNSGTRSEVIAVLLPILAVVYWKLPMVGKKYGLMFGLPALFCLGVFWSAASVLGRNEGRLKWDEATEAEYVGFEMFRELLFLVDAVPEPYPYQLGHTYYVQAVNPIPRFLWPGKPVSDAGLQLARMKGQVYQGEAILTISPGLIGEMYWNGGMAGVLALSGLLGFVARSWDRARPIAARSILTFTVFAAGLGIIVLSGRSFNMSTLYGMLALFGLLVLFDRPQRPYARRTPPPPARHMAPIATDE